MTPWLGQKITIVTAVERGKRVTKTPIAKPKAAATLALVHITYLTFSPSNDSSHRCVRPLIGRANSEGIARSLVAYAKGTREPAPGPNVAGWRPRAF